MVPEQWRQEAPRTCSMHSPHGLGFASLADQLRLARREGSPAQQGPFAHHCRQTRTGSRGYGEHRPDPRTRGTPVSKGAQMISMLEKQACSLHECFTLTANAQ
jgi:hypothetical protein